MRPGLNRDIVRENTAYRVGRVTVDILLALQWIGTVLFLVLFFRMDPKLEGQAGLASLSLVAGSAVISSVLALALRELAHAVFDMADSALESRAGQGVQKQS